MNDIDKTIESLIDQRELDEQSIDLTEYDDQEQLNFELLLQEKINASLARSFPKEPNKELAHRSKMETLVSSSRSAERRKTFARVGIFGTVLAASLLLLASFVILPGIGGNTPEVVFNREPLKVMLEESVGRGFKPYYVCDDPVRFANQFRKQHGVPLQLAQMPEHKKMVGISFLGGVSGDSTAMLGLVNDKPVLVVVDNINKDDEAMQSQVGKQVTENGTEYYVSRSTKEDLVFYEISGFENAQLIEFFERATSK